MRHKIFPGFTAAAAAAVFVLSTLAGAASAEVETRQIRQTFPLPADGQPLRLANLAGRIELVPGQGQGVTVEATVHADGGSRAETARLLSEMKWVRGRDKKGREEISLSYSLDRHRSFHYSRPGVRNDGGLLDLFVDLGQTTGHYRGQRVKIVSRRSSSAPTLYADLRIILPADTRLALRNVVGPVTGNGELSGNLGVDTGSGDVRLASFAGHLVVDTGSGDVTVGTVRGQSEIDTGSGDVVIKRLIGNGKVDTGSGDVLVESVAAGRLSIDTGSGDVVVKNGMVSTLAADTGSGGVRVLGVELEELEADTGSGDVVVESSLARARSIEIETGSGDIRIVAGPAASFDLSSSSGSGDLTVGYSDAQLKREGRKVVGARRGAGKTVIRLETGSGDTAIRPKA